MLKWVDKYGTGYMILEVGRLRIRCHNYGKIFDDGTQMWSIWLSVNNACSKEIITTDRLRGTFADAQRKAEELIQTIKEDLI